VDKIWTRWWLISCFILYFKKSLLRGSDIVGTSIVGPFFLPSTQANPLILNACLFILPFCIEYKNNNTCTRTHTSNDHYNYFLEYSLMQVLVSGQKYMYKNYAHPLNIWLFCIWIFFNLTCWLSAIKSVLLLWRMIFLRLTSQETFFSIVIMGELLLLLLD
jgi:hypothetical protein